MTDRMSVLAWLARVIADGSGDRPLAQRLCVACVEILDAHGVAITLASSRPERLTVWATDGTSARLEDLQDVLGEGPGQEAFDTNAVVITHIDGETHGRYPLFTELAGAAAGAATIWALPMRISGGRAVGVVTLYRRGGRLAGTLEDAQLLADAVGAVVINDPDGPVNGQAWSLRARVHQATGMVVAQLRMHPDDALALLRAHAFADSSSVDAVAEAVITRELTFAQAEDSTESGTP
ncbi:ANTAR domain-containing protein [Cellulomonas fengjieae]|uniref:ANTAR domain-containing protein n=1 Tax=Cellulomonas fengjieae TaxID=2819978 RepID=A0ABS3SIA4_9CELL|nr:ANTAR domain-containing protein [Cellulomonas fengjieae]MBO3085482.1 ANTAR domain-containing protein [Cellulomonas fengjieae]QVI64471.1 ANTAR domain-containing protein [Cellulomonas fengjieae]